MKRWSWSGLALALLIAFAHPIEAAGGTENLGTIDFPTSAKLPEAQEHFLRGVLLLHSFTLESAEEAFKEASRIEPGFAMAYWGEALSHNHPLSHERELDAPRKALERLAPTRDERLAKAPTERERGFLEAVEILFGEGTSEQRASAYADKMAELAAKHPNDDEVQAFYSVALLAKWGRVGDPDFRIRMKAGAIAQEIFRENPDHPGAAHYVIHSFDDPIHAPLALVAAKRYAQIAPDAAHALHMPSHIFIQHGMWDRVVASNDASYGSAWRLWQHRDELSETGRFYNDLYVWHALDWGQYGDLQLGNYEKAWKAIDLLKPVSEKATARRVIEGVGEMTARYIVETEQWKTFPMTDETTAHELFATAMSATRTGDVATAEKAAATLEALYQKMKGSGQTPFDRGIGEKPLGIMHHEAAALVNVARGEGEAAIEHMKKAIDIEQSRALPNGAASPVKPVHELYGEILLGLDRPEEAVEQFETSLLRMRNRVLSLRGLARAAAKKGDVATALETYQKLVEILGGYQNLPSYQEAKGYLTATGVPGPSEKT